MKHHASHRFPWLLVLPLCALAMVATHVSADLALPSQETRAGLSARILVVYYTRTGNTEQMAHGVIRGPIVCRE